MAWAASIAPWICRALEISGENVTRMPMTNHNGTPMKMQRRYFVKRFQLVNSDRKFPRATCAGPVRSCLNIPDSATLMRKIKSSNPSPPPMK